MLSTILDSLDLAIEVTSAMNDSNSRLPIGAIHLIISAIIGNSNLGNGILVSPRVKARNMVVTGFVNKIVRMERVRSHIGSTNGPTPYVTSTNAQIIFSYKKCMLAYTGCSVCLSHTY